MVKEYQLTKRGKNYYATGKALDLKDNKLLELLRLILEKKERTESLEDILYPNSQKDKFFPNLVANALKQGFITFGGPATYQYPLLGGVAVKIAKTIDGFSYADYKETRYSVNFLVPFDTQIHTSRGGRTNDTYSDADTIIPPERARGIAADRICREIIGHVNYVIIDHEDGTFAMYQNFGKYQVKVRMGQEVLAGELLGYSGYSGILDESNPSINFNLFKKVGKRIISLPVKFQKRIQNIK